MTIASRPGLMAYCIAIIVVALDQVLKTWVLLGLRLPLVGSTDVWGPIRLTMVRNQGVSFGLLQSDGAMGRWLLVGFSVFVVAALALWIRVSLRSLQSVGVGLIMGGATGNLFDRLAHGSVVDFIDLQSLYFPWIFNLADSAITLGVIVLIIEGLLPSRKV